MKKKDIITLIVCIVFIGGSVFVAFKMLNPSKPAPVEETTASSQPEFTGNIDTDTINKLKERQDYGEATLESIGRENPFSSL